MNKIFLAPAFFYFAHALSFAQGYNQPASAVYDSIRNRYLVCNQGNNTIVERNAAGVVSNFITSGLARPGGMAVVGDTLFVADGNSIRGFRLSDKSLVMNINQFELVVDVTYDNQGNLYATDPFAPKIYKINIATQQISTVTDTVVECFSLVYDKRKEQLIAAVSGNPGRIWRINFENNLSEYVATLANTSHVFGVSVDNYSNYYVAASDEGKIYKYDSTFIVQPQVVATGFTFPTDIFYNTNNDTLVVPDAGTNTVSFVKPGITNVEEHILQNNTVSLLQNFPNPFSSRTKISLRGKGLFEVRDLLGRIVYEKNISSDEEKVFFDGNNLPTGIYTYSLFDGVRIEARRMILSK